MDKLADLIAGAAETLGVEAARVWPQLILHTFILACVDLGLSLLVLAGAACFIVRTTRWLAGRTGHEHGEGLRVLAMLSIAGVSLMCVVLVFALPGTIAAISSPEAKTVLKLIGK